MRYRGGVVTDYSSRLHYLSDWIDDNIVKNIVDNHAGEIRAERADSGGARFVVVFPVNG